MTHCSHYLLLYMLQLFSRTVLILLIALGEIYSLLYKTLCQFRTRLTTGGVNQKTERGTKPTSLETMSLVFSQDDLSTRDLVKVAEVVSWCLNLGCQYIFIYDQKGLLKSQFEPLQELLSGSNPDLAIAFHSGWNKYEPMSTMVTIHVLCGEDSVSPLLYVSSKPDSKADYQGLQDVQQYWSTDFTIDQLNCKISESFGAAAVIEPKAIVVIGPVFSLVGCSPFHARFAEIYYLGNLQNLTFQSFCSSLKKYWNTKQRFGV